MSLCFHFSKIASSLSFVAEVVLMELELCFISSLLSFLLLCFLSGAYGDMAELALSTSTVTYLPGFEGPLPFHLETGYVGVGASSQHQLFYYFAPSENDPGEDPLILWLTGGPGCSALSGLAFEIGPFQFKNLKFDGVGIPPLELNPHSWTKVASLIFLDQPIGTGFSYTDRTRNEPRGDIESINDTLEFFRKWLIGHPEFISNSLYIGGDSYAGKLVPIVAVHIATGIDHGEEPKMNLKGYVIGNPFMDSQTDKDSRVSFAHGMGLISEELYMSAKKNCKGAYTIAPNRDCKNDLDTIEKLLSKLNMAHILDNLCSILSPKPYQILRDRSLEEKSMQSSILPEDLPTYGCRNYMYLLAQYWANNDSVRNALGIRKNSVEKWVRCLRDNYLQDVGSSISFHRSLSARGYRALVYSGDHDCMIPHIGTQAWIKSLNYSIVDDWRPWFLDNQVAGYTRSYSNKMTFATVKGAGHIAPEYKPVECLAMISRWISHSPL